ncbi:MAG: hypothetical protein ACSHWU_08580 [Marinicella sp.]
MPSKIRTPQITTLLITALFLTASIASVQAKNQRKGPPKGKPPEAAFTACADQTEAGSQCNFENKRGETVAGTCRIPRKDEGVLVCKPEKEHRQKPQQ